MITYKIIFGSSAIVIALASYVPYYRDILIGKTKPHAFSWLVWAITASVVFAAQIVKHGGAGFWVNVVTILACFGIFFIALAKGQRKFALLDWASLTTAFIALILWRITHEPTLAVILVTLTDAFGFLPTFRKAYYKPYEETLSLYALAGTKFVFSLFALESFSLATWLFPGYLVLANGLFVTLLLWRRSKIKNV